MMDEETKERTAAQRVRLIEALRGAGEQGLKGHELREIAPHYTARMSELYGRGYDIQVLKVNSKVYRYVLRGEPKEEQKPVHPLQLVLSEIEQRGGAITDSEMMGILEKHKLHVCRRSGSLKVSKYKGA